MKQLEIIAKEVDPFLNKEFYVKLEEFNELSNELNENETILYIIFCRDLKGGWSDSDGILIALSERVIFIGSAKNSKFKKYSFNFGEINKIEISKGMMYNNIKLHCTNINEFRYPFFSDTEHKKFNILTS